MAYGDNAPKVATAEVLDIILNSAHPKYEDRDSIGKLRANIMTGSGQSPARAKWFKPMFTNISTYPLIGELVLLVEAAGPASTV